MMKDESEPVRANYHIAARGLDAIADMLKRSVDAIQPTEKFTQVPPVGHKLHRVTTMTGKTAQFHLLANGNPKPDNLLVSPLVQIELNGTRKQSAAAVGVKDRI
jgi:hypothetical protein